MKSFFICFLFCIISIAFFSNAAAEKYESEYWNHIEKKKEKFYAKSAFITDFYTSQSNFFEDSAEVSYQNSSSINMAFGYSYAYQYSQHLQTEIELTKSKVIPMFGDLDKLQLENFITNIHNTFNTNNFSLLQMEDLFSLTRLSLLFNNYYNYGLNKQVDIYLGIGLGPSLLYDYRGCSGFAYNSLGLGFKFMFGGKWVLNDRTTLFSGYRYLMSMWFNQRVNNWVAKDMKEIDAYIFDVASHGLEIGMEIAF